MSNRLRALCWLVGLGLGLGFGLATLAQTAAARDRFDSEKLNLDRFQKNFDSSVTKSFREREDGLSGRKNERCCGEETIRQRPDICEIDPNRPECKLTK